MREEYVLQKIKSLLDERKWTLYRLAKESEIRYSTLNNSFHRNNVPSISTLIQVCEAFGITLSEFFDEKGTTVKQLTTSDANLLAGYHHLPRDDRKLLYAYMQGLLKISSAPDAEKGRQGKKTPK